MRAHLTQKTITSSALSLVFLLSYTSLTVADPAPIMGDPAATAAPAAGDPPARVGRLSYTEGTVSFHTANQDQWSFATKNYPITTGDAFWTEAGARSELQVGPAEIRMDNSTELDVVRLDDSGIQFEVPQGDINVHLAQVPEGGIQISTPNGQVILNQPGSYHIDSGHPQGDVPAPQAEVTTLEGTAQVEGANETVEVQAGERATMTGNPPEVALAEGNATPFDNWALAREKREQPHQAAQYVSPQTTGYQDLDNYGQWSQAPQYGNVWYPQAVPVGWAPYRYGHWVFVEPWGWTWVDDAPWGFTPFHYGRWVQIGPRWAWCPGVIAPHPVYAPALVAFIGGGGFSLSIGIGTGPIGWVPLAPFEVFHPYYHVSPGYLRNVNMYNVHETVINNINNHNTNFSSLANRSAVTSVSANTFARGAAVHNAQVPMSQSQLSHATVMNNLSHITPTAQARVGGTSTPQGTAPHPAALEENRAARNAVAPSARAATPEAAVQSRVAATPATTTHTGAPGPSIASHEAVMNRSASSSPNVERNAAPSSATPRITRGTSSNAALQPAPGPAIHHATPAAPVQRQASTQQSRSFPEPHSRPTPAVRTNNVQTAHSQVSHPTQQTRIAPTPKGWVRQAPEEKHDTQGEKRDQSKQR